MSERPPEIPSPFPPGREPPRRTDPVVVPLVDVGSGRDVEEQLMEQRRVLVSGPLDRGPITDLAARLMTLDGLSSRPVEMVVSSPGGPVSEIFAVLDVITLMRAPVNVTCIGAASGTAVALVACGTGERRAGPHATFSLRLAEPEQLEGTTTDIATMAEQLAHLRARYLAVLGSATGQGEKILADEIDRGARHTADEAIALGIVDTIARPSSDRRSRDST